jgi:hypothetical protein
VKLELFAQAARRPNSPLTRAKRSATTEVVLSRVDEGTDSGAVLLGAEQQASEFHRDHHVDDRDSRDDALKGLARNHEADPRHQDGDTDRDEEVLQRPQTRVQAEDEPRHDQILLQPTGHGLLSGP